MLSPDNSGYYLQMKNFLSTQDFFKPHNLFRPWLWFSFPLSKEQLDPNPYIQFVRWYRLALNCFWLEFPDAVCLSTVDSVGKPDARMVLLKGINPKGLMFFSNYNSNKGMQLASNDSACMTFFWDGLQRQIRIKGQVCKLSEEDSDQYFNSRSTGSRASAILSKQSQILHEPLNFHNQINEFIKNSADISIRRPDYWGGYMLTPNQFEFWKARKNRTHDRFIYTLKNSDWHIDQLYP